MAKEDWHNFFKNIKPVEFPKNPEPVTMFICREVDRDTGKIRVYLVGKSRGASWPYDSRENVRHLHDIYLNRWFFATSDSNYFENIDKIEELLSREKIPDEKTLSDYRIEELR